MPAGAGSTVDGIYQYGELDVIDALFSDYLNKVGASLRSAWTAYTPVLSAGAGNPNLGTTASKVGAFKRIGKTVLWRSRLVSAGTGIAAGSGGYGLSLPVPATGTDVAPGQGFVFNGGQFYPFIMRDTSMIRTDTRGFIANDIGPTAAGWVLSVAGSYEAA